MLNELPDAALDCILGKLLPADLGRAECACKSVRRACSNPAVWAASSATSFDLEDPLSEPEVMAVVRRAAGGLRKLNADCPATNRNFLEALPRELEALGYDSFGYSESVDELEEILARFPNLKDVSALIFPYASPPAIVTERRVRGLWVSFLVDGITAETAKWLSLENAQIEFRVYDQQTAVYAVAPEFAKALKDTETLKHVYITDDPACDFGPIIDALCAVSSIDHLTLRSTSWTAPLARLLARENVKRTTVYLDGDMGDEGRLDALCGSFRGSPNLSMVDCTGVDNLSRSALDRLRAAIPHRVHLVLDDPEVEDRWGFRI